MSTDKIFIKKGGVIMENLSWSVSYFWHRILCNLEARFNSIMIAAWFDRTEVVSVEGNKLFLKESSSFRRELISRKLLAVIQEAAKEEFGFDIEVVLREE